MCDAQFLGWDKAARRNVDFGDRTDHGDSIVAREFDYSVKNQLIYSENGVSIYSTPVKHYGIPGPVALRLEWNGLVFTYSGMKLAKPKL